jgi:hypothetical protein
LNFSFEQNSINEKTLWEISCAGKNSGWCGSEPFGVIWLGLGIALPDRNVKRQGFREDMQTQVADIVFFQALKKRGFNLEESFLRSLEKYRKLFALVSIAYTICWATEIQDEKKNPVRAKKHKYPQYSIFRRGFNLMRKFYRDQESR